MAERSTHGAEVLCPIQARRDEKKLGTAGLCRRLTEWRNRQETLWLADSPVHPLQQSLKDLERAYSNFFAQRAGFPRFKKKGLRASFRYPDPKQIKLDQANSRLFLPKLGWLRYRKSRNIEGAPKTMALRREIAGWHVSVQTERTGQVACNATAIGAADRGITHFLATADGELVAPLNAHRESLHRLRRYQRAVSRRMEVSVI